MISLGPSGASRWLRCQASPGLLERLKDRLPEDVQDYTTEGTRAHETAAALLTDVDIPKNVTPEMLAHVQAYVAKVRDLAGSDELFVEQKIPLWFMPERNGMVDATILRYNRKGAATYLHIVDLKYGAGVMVDAVDNEQLICYSYAMIQHLESSGICMFTDPKMVVRHTIYQPRARDGVIEKHWETSLADLRDHALRIQEIAEVIQLDPHSPDLPYCVDDKVCQFCPARTLCRPFAEKILGEMPPEIEQELLPKPAKGIKLPEALSLGEIAQVLTGKSRVAKWLNDVADYAAEIHPRTPIPGFKLVAGKGSRDWVDEAQVLKLLRCKLPFREVCIESVITPAKADEKLKGKELSTRFTNRLKELTLRREGKPALVPESDPRPVLNDNPIQDFTSQD